MKARKVSWLVVGLVLASLLFASTASANWFTATINRVGVTTGGYYVYLDFAGVSGTRYFLLDDTIKKELLAVILAAQSNGKKIMVDIPTRTSLSGPVIGAYMLNE